MPKPLPHAIQVQQAGLEILHLFPHFGRALRPKLHGSKSAGGLWGNRGHAKNSHLQTRPFCTYEEQCRVYLEAY
jgi:hypothetical protein